MVNFVSFFLILVFGIGERVVANAAAEAGYEFSSLQSLCQAQNQDWA